VRDRVDFLRLLAEGLEGGTIGRIEGERGEVVAPRHHEGSALRRRAALLELPGHLLVDLLLKRRRRGLGRRVVGIDGQGDLARLERLAQPSIALEGLGAIVVGSGQGGA